VRQDPEELWWSRQSLTTRAPLDPASLPSPCRDWGAQVLGIHRIQDSNLK